MLFLVYDIFKKYNEDSFDEFIYWGEILLNDFDDIDKYCVNARSLFTNIMDIEKIETEFSYLEPEQIEFVSSFWKNFIPSFESEKKKSFESNWDKLYDIYNQFRSKLFSEGFAYEGMMYRDVVERLRQKEIEIKSTDKIIFIGFNALTTVERELMIMLRNQGVADFYWDYESCWLSDKNNRASFFRDRNLSDFPSFFEIENDKKLQDPKTIRVIGVASAIGQTKYISEILNELLNNGDIGNCENALNTALVLSDENLLIPTLYSIPKEYDPINVTMGTSLKNTPIAGFIDYIYELQRLLLNKKNGFYHKIVYSILNHKYVRAFSEEKVDEILKTILDKNLVYVDEELLKGNPLIEAIFRPLSSSDNVSEYLINIFEIIQKGTQNNENEDGEDQVVEMSDLDMEFVYHYYLMINRLSDIVKEYDTEISTLTFFKLLKKMTESLSVPFSGEPLAGLQIMGVLETRVLDFDNVILLSANEGVFPKKGVATSFIPVNLRKGFKLSTTEHQDAIFAYHFYHLISRAKNIFILYDTRTGGSSTGEVTRYVHQLKYHYGVNLEEININYDIRVPAPVNLSIEKNDIIKKKLQAYLSDSNPRYLSASTINTYINCPLAFYIKHVEKIEEENTVTDNMGADVFGTIFHSVMEYIYEEKKGKEVTSDWINDIINDDQKIKQLIKSRFSEFLFKNNKDEDLKGYNILIGEVLLTYVKQVLKYDANHAPFIYIESEKKLNLKYSYDGINSVNIKGSIDRVDYKDETFRIIDYKTGSGKLEFKSMQQLFDINDSDRPKAIMQTFMYSMLFNKKEHSKSILPNIFYLKDFFSSKVNNSISVKSSKDEENDLPIGEVENFVEIEDKFKEAFDKCISEIFDYTIPFTQAENQDNCKYCELKIICKR